MSIMKDQIIARAFYRTQEIETELQGKIITVVCKVGIITRLKEDLLIMPFLYRVRETVSPISTWFWCDLVGCPISGIELNKIHAFQQRNKDKEMYLMPPKVISANATEIRSGNPIRLD